MLVHVVPPRPPMPLASVPVAGHPVATAPMAELDQIESDAAFASVADKLAGTDAERITEHGYAPIASQRLASRPAWRGRESLQTR